MNHPKPEEWVPYLYGETSGAARQDLKAHLRDCPECRQEIDNWKRSLHQLDRWKLPRAGQALVQTRMPLLRWAAAVVIILSAGILIGRATAPKVDVERLRVAITPAIQREVSAELAQFARDEAARTASLTLASGRRYTDQVAQQLYAALKKDVDTLALNADEGLRNTAAKLFQLADYHPDQDPGDSDR